ncbi:porin [Catenovulum adriaticum]|uniref:Porin n=1 Tax=Catenovulum adriaticum TaxID=2984846 RepID=A0ABY7AS90_9ALTE|nr:porin [Catenovulum sp. TS8]WAJ71365.1 porin [Catenovulum sp. TS8]
MKSVFYTALATSVLLTTAAQAQSDLLTVYGRANISLQFSESDETATDLKSNSSRFGVKGEAKLENDLIAIYQAEFGVDFTDESKEQNITARNQYVGLKGHFGQVRLGRMDTAHKFSQGKVDLFNNYNADIKRLFSGEIRANDSITYISPSYNQFSLGVTYLTQEENDAAERDSAGLSTALMYGDKNLKKSSLYSALALDNDVKGEDRVRFVVQKSLGQFTLGAMAQRQKNNNSGESATGYLLNAAYQSGEFKYKVQHQLINGDRERSTSSIGVDYKLGSATKAFAWLSYDDHYENNDIVIQDRRTTVAFGLEHKF